MPSNAEFVKYNDGDGDRFALVATDNGDDNLDLIVRTASGWEDKLGVPKRDPADYGPEGGGHTWHD